MRPSRYVNNGVTCGATLRNLPLDRVVPVKHASKARELSPDVEEAADYSNCSDFGRFESHDRTAEFVYECVLLHHSGRRNLSHVVQARRGRLTSRIDSWILRVIGCGFDVGGRTRRSSPGSAPTGIGGDKRSQVSPRPDLSTDHASNYVRRYLVIRGVICRPTRFWKNRATAGLANHAGGA